MKLAVVAFILLAAATAASAQDKPPLLANDVKMHFRAPPQNFYPMRALEAGIVGKAQVRCTINQKGRFEDCAVDEETPSGWDLGAALLKLMTTGRVDRTAKDGSATEGRTFVMRMTYGIGEPR